MQSLFFKNYLTMYAGENNLSVQDKKRIITKCQGIPISSKYIGNNQNNNDKLDYDELFYILIERPIEHELGLNGNPNFFKKFYLEQLHNSKELVKPLLQKLKEKGGVVQGR